MEGNGWSLTDSRCGVTSRPAPSSRAAPLQIACAAPGDFSRSVFLQIDVIIDKKISTQNQIMVNKRDITNEGVRPKLPDANKTYGMTRIQG